MKEYCPFCPYADLVVLETYEFPLCAIPGIEHLEAVKDTGNPDQVVWCRGCDSDLREYYSVEYDGIFLVTPTDALLDLLEES